jgi:opacity protein-like surface antigen
MRVVSIMIVAVLLLGYSATHASAKGFYADAYGGSVFAQSDFARLSDPLLPSSIGSHGNYDVGWLAGAAGGYELPIGFAFEGEFTFRQNDIDRIANNQVLFTGGDLHSFAMMANGYYRLHNSTPFTPYIGGGIGEAVVALNNTRPVGINGNFGGTDAVFAYQAIAGVSYAFTPRLSLAAEYRYFATVRPGFQEDLAGLPDFKISPDYETHNAVLKMTYSFGK